MNCVTREDVAVGIKGRTALRDEKCHEGGRRRNGGNVRPGR